MLRNLAFTLAIFIPILGLCQRSISGIVINNQNDPLIFATIQITNSTKGTFTDENGKFTLELAALDSLLTISYTGYSSKKINIKSLDEVNIILEKDIFGLDEIIVVGYVSQRKKDITGSVFSVDMVDYINTPLPSLQVALQGSAPGVYVNKNSGKPGGGIDVNIRGKTSILASNQPLYIIDGIPVTLEDNFDFWGGQFLGGSRVSILTDINPDDIESIEVLKDASAASMYGSRAANGVVLITTKKGKSGTSEISLNISNGISWTPKKFSLLNKSQYIQYVETLFEPLLTEIGEDVSYQNVQDFFLGPLGNSDNSWQDLIFRVAHSQDFNLNISGGSEKTKYYASFGYLNEEGIILGSNFDRYSGRIKIEHKFSEKISIQSGLYFTRSNTAQNYNGINNRSVLFNAINLPPVIPLHRDDGSFGKALNLENPVASATLYENNAIRDRIMLNNSVTWNIAPELYAQVTVNADIINNSVREFTPIGLFGNFRGSRVDFYLKSDKINYEYLLNYSKNYGKHNLSSTIGASFLEETGIGTATFVSDLPTNEFNSIESGASVSVSGGKGVHVLNSYFFHLNYNYASQFYLSTTIRIDGSSRFVKNKWGAFPGVSLGYNVIKDIGSGIGFINNLKVKLGWGKTGNNVFEDFIARQLYSGGAEYFESPAIVPAQVGNPDLVWETTEQINAGLDFILLDKKVSGTLEFYRKLTSDLILDNPIPSSSGFTTSIMNVGKIENKGIDLSINLNLIQSESINWQSQLSIGYLKNTVLELVNGLPILSAFSIQRTAVNQPLGSFYGYVADGLFQNQADIESWAIQNNAAPGDIRFLDLSGGPGPDGLLGTSDDLPPDGIINDYDKTFIGNAIPNITGGLRNTIHIKNFDINIFFQFALGFQISNFTRVWHEGLDLPYNMTQEAWFGRWQKEGIDTDFPRVALGDPNGNLRGSTRFIEDGDYIRFKSMVLGYTFKKENLNKVGFSGLRVFLSAYNIFTLTGYSGYDPEANFIDDQNELLALDGFTYPQPRSLLLGLNLKF